MGKPHKLSQLARSRAFVLGLMFVIMAAVVLWARNRDPLYASPRSERDDVQTLFARTWDQYNSEKPPKTARLPLPELSKASTLHYPRGVLVNLRSSPVVDDRIPTPVTAIQADKQGVAQLPGDATLRLAAFALHVPQPEDPSGPIALHFLQPDTLEPLSPADLDALGVSPEVRQINQDEQNFFPRLRMVLVSEGLAFRRLGVWRVFDERTRAMVTNSIQAPAQDFDKGAMVIDASLNIWHDTPLTLALELPCGEAERVPMPLEEGFQTQFQTQARFELVGVDPGKVVDVEKRSGAFYFQTQPDQAPEPPEGTVLLYRMFPVAWTQHTAFEIAGKQRERLYLDDFDVSWANVSSSPDDLESVELVFLPEKARVFFSIPDLPQMPNSRYVRNLFDVTIPQVWIPEGVEGDSMLPYVLIDIVAGATETSLDPMSASPLVDYPAKRGGQQFENVTPRELVAEYQRYAVDPYVRVDREEHSIVFHRPDPLLVKIQQWWYLNAPDWAKGKP